MPSPSLTKLGFHAGVWSGRLTAQCPDGVEIWCADSRLEDVTLQKDGKDAVIVSVPIPSEMLKDGINTFLILDPKTQTERESFVIAVADLDDEDMRAELKLLRAELDLLKKAFRRHVAETQND